MLKRELFKTASILNQQSTNPTEIQVVGSSPVLVFAYFFFTIIMFKW